MPSPALCVPSLGGYGAPAPSVPEMCLRCGRDSGAPSGRILEVRDGAGQPGLVVPHLAQLPVAEGVQQSPDQAALVVVVDDQPAAAGRRFAADPAAPGLEVP